MREGILIEVFCCFYLLLGNSRLLTICAYPFLQYTASIFFLTTLTAARKLIDVFFIGIFIAIERNQKSGLAFKLSSLNVGLSLQVRKRTLVFFLLNWYIQLILCDAVNRNKVSIR
jgi:hypothetical protein